MLETLIGGALGGIFRLIPEGMKVWDRKNERKHELDMQDKALEFEKLRGDQKLTEIHEGRGAAWDAGAMSALVESIKGQNNLPDSWAGRLSASVRPIITYMFMSAYLSTKVASVAAAYQQKDFAGFAQAIATMWTQDDMALLAGILNFWFLGRVFDKAGK